MAGAVYPDLAGQSVIITGGGTGIGREISRVLGRHISGQVISVDGAGSVDELKLPVPVTP